MLYDSYLNRVKANDDRPGGKYSSLPYCFDRLQTGQPISAAMRAVYRRYRHEIPVGTDPFALDAGFFNAPLTNLPTSGPNAISRLQFEIYASHPELQRPVDPKTEAGMTALLTWLRLKLIQNSGEPETRARIRRNDPCPCGSGKKYKQCHGRLA